MIDTVLIKISQKIRMVQQYNADERIPFAQEKRAF